MEIIGITIWAALLWWGFRRFRPGAPTRDAGPEVPAGNDVGAVPPPGAGAGGGAHRPAPSVRREGEALVDGAIIGGYLVHRHYQNRLEEFGDQHADELAATHDGAWVEYGGEDPDELDELDQFDEYGAYDEYDDFDSFF